MAWQPRRWQWVDPLKEMEANRSAVELRTRSISDIIREQGKDPNETWAELANDLDTLRGLGIDMTPPSGNTNANTGQN